MNHITAPGKKARGRLSGFSVAFIILFVLFFAAGFGSLGSFRSTGKAFSYVSGDNNIAVFNLEMTDKQSKLTAVYVNVGNVYTELGADTRITVKRTNSLDTKPGITVGEATIGNIYSKKDKTEGANFNWISIATGKDKLDASAKTISFSATANLDLNEIVCIGNDGKPIPMSVNTELSQGFSLQKKQLSYAIDAPNSFIGSNAARNNFTAEEAYYMTSIHTVLGGGAIASGSVYNVDRDFNSLATVLLLPSVAVFGDSTFALRLTPFLATCATLILVYLFGSLLFKDEKYGFVFALLFAVGGLATTVGRLGAPYALLACFLVASAYFMYRFFSKGISSERVVRGGLNVLFSGLFAALALAMNFLSIFPVAAILALFGFGMRRQKLAYKNELVKHLPAPPSSESASEFSEEQTAETEAKLGTLEKENRPAASEQAAKPAAAEKENKPAVAEKDIKSAAAGKGAAAIALIGREGKEMKAAYEYKTRISWAFAAISFVLATFLFMLLASVVTYNAYVKTFDDPSNPSLSYAALLGKGFAAPFRIDNITKYTSANAVNVLAWLMPLKASTVYDAIRVPVASNRYLAWNVSMNAAVCVAALISFAFCTVSVISDLLSKERGGRIARRVRRIYLVLLGGILSAMLASAFVKNTSMLQSALFGVFYLGFIPLATKICQPAEIVLNGKGRAKTSAADIILIVLCFIFAVFFALSVPSMYGFEISATAAKRMFGWTSIFSNGYFRV